MYEPLVNKAQRSQLIHLDYICPVQVCIWAPSADLVPSLSGSSPDYIIRLHYLVSAFLFFTTRGRQQSAAAAQDRMGVRGSHCLLSHRLNQSPVDMHRHAGLCMELWLCAFGMRICCRTHSDAVKTWFTLFGIIRSKWNYLDISAVDSHPTRILCLTVRDLQGQTKAEIVVSFFLGAPVLHSRSARIIHPSQMIGKRGQDVVAIFCKEKPLIAPLGAD